jgi:hypothetical protein
VGGSASPEAWWGFWSCRRVAHAQQEVRKCCMEKAKD